LATDPETQVRFPALPEKKVVGLERGPLSLLSTTEELLDRQVAGPVYKTENTSVGIRHAYHVAPSISKKLAITSATSGGRSVGIVRSRTQTMEFFLDLDRKIILKRVDFFSPSPAHENIFSSLNVVFSS
jgi:hypothetical protein